MIAVHKAVLGTFTEVMEEVVFVDLDFDQVHTPFNDYDLLPNDLRRRLEDGITAFKESKAAAEEVGAALPVGSALGRYAFIAA